MPSDPLDYRSPTTSTPRSGRPLGKWLILMAVWMVGVIVWVVYLAFAAIVLLRIL